MNLTPKSSSISPLFNPYFADKILYSFLTSGQPLSLLNWVHAQLDLTYPQNDYHESLMEIIIMFAWVSNRKNHLGLNWTKIQADESKKRPRSDSENFQYCP